MPSFHFTFWQLFCGLFFSSVGYVYFSYGKRTEQHIYLIVGIALMAFCFFVTSTAWLIGVGVALSAIPFVLS